MRVLRRTVLKEHQDAYGREIYDYYKTGISPGEIVERDDGYFDVSDGPGVYFSDYDKWPSYERKAMRYARGKVLDIGSGAGRHALYLQGKGLEVVAIDNSPLAVEVCRLRGVRDARVLALNGISAGLGVFDTVLMMCNNFGLFGSYEGARRLLRRLAKVTSDKGRVIAASADTYKTEAPEHRSYHNFNRGRGRMAGQLRLRVRYKKMATPWFDYLLVSKEELEDIVAGTGWQVSRCLDSGGPRYIAIIDKKG
jgi:SAM-dependent methyltransferase